MAIDDDQAPQSKSQRKRDSLALQALADELAQLSPVELEAVPLPEPLREAVAAARELSRGAYRRQVRYLGRLLRDIDAEPIRAAVEARRGASHEDKARLKRLERWRERLLEEGDAAVAELLEEFPGADAQQLRQLLRTARREQESGRPPRSYRQLFRFLREL
jgi:ribosome-associated protein